jgi:hypothetical protein
MYEYMASGTPILGIGPEDGDAAEILTNTKSGHIIDRSHIDQMKSMILDHYISWKNKELRTTPGAPEFSRRELTKKMCEILALSHKL